MQGGAGFELTTSVDDVAMAEAVAAMLLVGHDGLGHCVGNGVDTVACRELCGGW